MQPLGGLGVAFSLTGRTVAFSLKGNDRNSSCKVSTTLMGLNFLKGVVLYEETS